MIACLTLGFHGFTFAIYTVATSYTFGCLLYGLLGGSALFSSSSRFLSRHVVYHTIRFFMEKI